MKIISVSLDVETEKCSCCKFHGPCTEFANCRAVIIVVAVVRVDRECVWKVILDLDGRDTEYDTLVGNINLYDESFYQEQIMNDERVNKLYRLADIIRN